MTPLEQKFQKVPQNIRDWFGSDTVTEAIIAIEELFQLSEDEVAIPHLLFSVEVKDLSVSELPQALASQLGVAPATATSIYEEIKKRIFNPLAPELVAFGIGVKELALPEAPRPESVPMPVPGSLPPAASTGAIASQTVHLPTRPLAADGPMPAPVSLYKDALASQARIPTARVGSLSGVGDVTGSVSTPTPTYRPARVDLGMQSTRVDDTLKSIFVERETPKSHSVNYGMTPATPPAAPTGAPQPVTLQTASTIPGAPIQAISQTVALPQTPTVALGPTTPPNGLMDRLMRKIAPWHAARFGEERPRAANAVAAPAGTEVNYVPEAPAPTPPKS